jgi:hypothetical protein
LIGTALNAAVVNDPKPTSDERNCLNGDEHAGDVRAEADHTGTECSGRE